MQLPMQFHRLKIWPQFFEAVLDGRKTYELRKNDRHFQVGDMVELMEWVPEDKWFTGRGLIHTITYITYMAEGLAEDYVILGLGRNP